MSTLDLQTLLIFCYTVCSLYRDFASHWRELKIFVSGKVNIVIYSGDEIIIPNWLTYTCKACVNSLSAENNAFSLTKDVEIEFCQTRRTFILFFFSLFFLWFYPMWNFSYHAELKWFSSLYEKVLTESKWTAVIFIWRRCIQHG